MRRRPHAWSLSLFGKAKPVEPGHEEGAALGETIRHPKSRPGHRSLNTLTAVSMRPAPSALRTSHSVAEGAISSGATGVRTPSSTEFRCGSSSIETSSARNRRAETSTRDSSVPMAAL